jgi:amino acid adenylation domain-containing protein
MQINILEYFEKNVLPKFSDKTAIVDNDISYTIRELEIYAKKLAHLIIQKGDFINRPIAAFLPRSANVVIADLAITYSGNIYVNLDIKSPGQRIKNLLGNIQPALIITNKELADNFGPPETDSQSIILIEEIYAKDIKYDNEAILRRLETLIDTDPFCIINTSGSTGLQKSVVLNHRSFIDFTDWAIDHLQIGKDEIIGSLSPVFFDIYSFELCLCLARGATIIFIPDKMAAFPTKIVEFLKQHHINFIFWVPTIMVNIANLDILSKIELPALRKILFAGEVFPTKHLNYWRKHISQASYINLYGPIEITLDCTYYIVDREFTDDEPIPIGFPCRNTDVLILNDDNKLAKPGEPGELCVRGTSLALGYWNHPENTSKAFVQNPLNASYPEVIYRTGDLVCKNDRNEIMFIGRKDFQIKHLGYRIELGEIEQAVLSTFSLIQNACALYNKNKKEITLFYEAKTEISPAYLRQKLSELLPKYMLPTAFLQLKEMPRNPNGKIDRNFLNTQLQKNNP